MNEGPGRKRKKERGRGKIYLTCDLPDEVELKKKNTDKNAKKERITVLGVKCDLADLSLYLTKHLWHSVQEREQSLKHPKNNLTD